MLAEVDARQLYLGEGCSSLFTYCTQVLHFLEHAAYHRIEAARAARRYHIMLELVANGDLTDAKALIRRLPEVKSPREVTIQGDRETDSHDRESGPTPVTLTPVESEASAPTVGPRSRVAPLASDRYLSSRHIPATVRRAVWQRDAGRCAFVGLHGRCSETGGLEFHHLVPFARGGAAEVPNIALRCRAHNSFESAQIFGPWTPEANPAGSGGRSSGPWTATMVGVSSRHWRERTDAGFAL
jgi:5-methylcytosine-specific restriction endonuclease McrA